MDLKETRMQWHLGSLNNLLLLGVGSGLQLLVGVVSHLGLMVEVGSDLRHLVGVGSGLQVLVGVGWWEWGAVCSSWWEWEAVWGSWWEWGVVCGTWWEWGAACLSSPTPSPALLEGPHSFIVPYSMRFPAVPGCLGVWGTLALAYTISHMG